MTRAGMLAAVIGLAAASCGCAAGTTQSSIEVNYGVWFEGATGAEAEAILSDVDRTAIENPEGLEAEVREAARGAARSSGPDFVLALESCEPGWRIAIDFKAAGEADAEPPPDVDIWSVVRYRLESIPPEGAAPDQVRIWFAATTVHPLSSSNDDHRAHASYLSGLDGVVMARIEGALDRAAQAHGSRLVTGQGGEPTTP